jgi:hypothetical protein
METEEKSWLRVEMDKALHRQFRAAAIMHGMSIKDAAKEAVEMWLERYQSERVVKG